MNQTATMAEGTFSLRYEGTALDQGRMRVSDLAPALLALGDLVSDTHQIVNPNLPALDVEINSAPRQGSFIVDLIAMVQEQYGELALSDTALGVTQTITLVTGGHGLFDYIRLLRGRTPVREEPLSDGRVRVHLDDDSYVDAPADVVLAGNDINIRRHAKRVVTPLERVGIDGVGFETEETTTTVHIGSADLPSYDVPDEIFEDEPEPVRTEVVLRPRSISLESDGGWKMRDGQGEALTVTFEDDEFVRRVQSKEQPIGLGDRLVVQLRTEPGQGRKWNRHFVEHVLDHLPAPNTPQLDLDEAPRTDE